VNPTPNPDPLRACDDERTGRAAPMAPDDRRAAILAATVPVLRERGGAVTTRELAEAAGVAEGTLFRVFPDKASIVHAALTHALDPTELVAEIAALGGSMDLRETLTGVVRIVHTRSREVAALFAVATQLHDPDTPHPQHHPGRGHHRTHLEPVVAAVAGLLEPHAEMLRRSPEVCARMLVASVLVATGPLAGENTLEPDDVAALALDGIVVGDLPC
jgi:AcrR family transcriptional regulator